MNKEEKINYLKSKKVINTRCNPNVTTKDTTSGITLIALVITIIVLIILAGISINLVLGENGIITKTTKAKEETRAASVQEQKNLWQLSQDADKYTSSSKTESLQELVDRLVEEKLLTEEEKDQILGNEEKGIEAVGKVTIGGMTIVFETGSTAKTLVQAFKDGDIKVGDYLDYKPVEGTTLENPLTQAETGVSAEQNYTVDMSTTWRVLGLNEDGTELMITSGSPIKKDGEDPYLHLASAEGYAYCVETLDTVSAIYHNSKYASETRSMTMKDVERALGITVEKIKDETTNETTEIAYKTSDESKTPLEGFVSFYGQSYTYVSGDYAPENYLGLENEQVKVGDTVDGTAYMIPYTESNIVDSTSPVYDLLFKGTSEAEGYSKSYWLASPGVFEYPGFACFGLGAVYYDYAICGYGLFRSDGLFFEGWMAVRPVVSLKSNITVEDVKPTTGSEVDWETTHPDSLPGQKLTKGQVFENPIEFTVDGTTYVADEGWTWETWLSTSYNKLTSDFDVNDTSFWWANEENTINYYIGINGEKVSLTSTITSSESYEIIQEERVGS